LVSFGAFGASCTAILGDFKPPSSSGEGGGGGATSSSRSSSRASTASAGGGGSGGAPECKKDSDCMDPPQACLLPFCDGGVCATKPATEGAPAPKQVPGDCQQIICDANGAQHTVVDLTDSDDMNECTSDKCLPNGMAQHNPLTNMPCMSNGGTVCNDLGNCVECLDPGDCTGNGACVNFVCQTPSCTDMVKNQDETDIDCGGMVCTARCSDGKHCLANADCTSNLCQLNKCRPATCNNAMKDGTETDVDCGGAACVPCATGKKCTLNTDCSTGVCQSGTCRLATCGNGTKDGTETDVDCGGTSCGHCATGKMCLLPADCTSGVCTNNVCG
jgi:hypothetical protein